MNTEIFYVVSICISGEIFLEDQKVGKYGPDRNQGQLFLFLRKKIIKAISVKVNSIARSAEFRLWRWGGSSWKRLYFAVMNFCKTVGHSLSR